MAGRGNVEQFKVAHGVAHPSNSDLSFVPDEESKTKSGGVTEGVGIEDILVNKVQDLKSMIQKLYIKADNNTDRLDTAGW